MTCARLLTAACAWRRCGWCASQAGRVVTMSVVSGQDLSKRMRASRRALIAAAEGVPAARLVARPSDDAWSVVEVLAHLIDVDYHYLSQAVAIRDGKDHLFVGFDDARWKAEHA